MAICAVILICLLSLNFYFYLKNKYDSLTKVLSRRQFDKDYVRGNYTGLMICDIDYFKKCNDTFGHAFGDHVIMTVAQTLIKSSGKNYDVYRYGGEEFCILAKVKDQDVLLQCAEKLRENIEALKWDNDMHVTISIGTAFHTEGDKLFSIADQRLYQSKNSGRNCVN